MVGADVSSHRQHQFQVQFFDQANILPGVFQDWID